MIVQKRRNIRHDIAIIKKSAVSRYLFVFQYPFQICILRFLCQKGAQPKLSAHSFMLSDNSELALFYFSLLPTELVHLGPGLLQLFDSAHFFDSILKPQVSIGVHRDAYVAVAHQVLKGLGVHP